MRTLVLTALFLVLPCAPRAEERPAPAQAAPAGAVQAPKTKDAQKKKAAAKQKAAAKPVKKEGGKGDAALTEKPCEPVKPCPID